MPWKDLTVSLLNPYSSLVTWGAATRLTAGRLQTMCCRQRRLRNPGCMGMGREAEPRDGMLLLRAILSSLGFVTGKDERQSEAEETEQDQVPESR